MMARAQLRAAAGEWLPPRPTEPSEVREQAGDLAERLTRREIHAAELEDQLRRLRAKETLIETALEEEPEDEG